MALNVQLLWKSYSVVISALFVLALYSLYFSESVMIGAGVEQSLDCPFTPPDVSLPDMHAEIRELILDDFGSASEGAILMNGGFVTTRYDTDVEQVFRQESNFLYVTGYNEPNATIIIDISSRQSFLFIPDHPEDYAIWNGNIETPAQISEEYKISKVFYQAQLPGILSGLSNASPGDYVIFIMDNFVEFPNKDAYSTNAQQLENIIYNRRTIKTDPELELMRYAATVSSGAHEIVMNYTRPGYYEYNVEGRFLDGCFACGLTIQSYIPICASGNNSAILHYVANDRLMQDGDLLLIDAGAEYNGYGSDITRTFPVSGVFTEEQKEVYNMVLDVQYRVISRTKPGITLSGLQNYAKEFTCDQLVQNGYLTSTSEQCVTEKLYYYFFPHGVSHYIGIDVHDRYGPSSVFLAERNVITVEPGIYFNQALLDPVMKSPSLGHFFVSSKIQPLLDAEFGGVRIEDVVIVWEDAAEVISFAPKSVFGVETQMRT